MRFKNSGSFQSKDITNQRNGKVTALYQTTEKQKDGSYIWVMKCDCGKEFKRAASCFKKSITCGCGQRENSGNYQVVDYSGQIFMDIEFLRPTSKRKHTYTVWEVKCLLCGTEFEKAAYGVKRKAAKHNCQAWIDKYHTPKVKKGPMLPIFDSHVNSIYATYSKSAKERNLDFFLEKEYFRTLLESNCYYCGAEPRPKKHAPSLHGVFKWNGIDRVDNSFGYIPSNCVPCCKVCNFAKSNTPIDEFKNWIKTVYLHLKLDT